ncbi:MAG: sugar ABC transporter permease [Oscillospiraceae bacterium]|jgi:multiple sugar transport system permease protein|nr:sugar ABC transporter permease [Oscillospiraceae bacterium]
MQTMTGRTIGKALSVKRPKLRRHEELVGYLMASPTLIGILLFSVIPVFFSAFISFTSWNMMSPWEWVGLANYKTVFHAKMLSTIWTNTLKYIAIAIPGSIICGLLLALALNTPIRGVPLYRMAFFLPNITTTVAVCVVWTWLYDKNYGFLNNALSVFGIQPISWLSSRKWAMTSISIMSIWQAMGYDMIIIAAGLKSIDETYYEASRIDGASFYKQFARITLPMLTPTLFYLLVMHFIGFFQMFDAAFVMTSGGPGHSTTTIVMHIYNVAFTYFRMGEASSYAWILFAVVFVITIVQFLLQDRWVNYDA